MGLGVTILAFAGLYHLVLRRSVKTALVTWLLVVAGLGMVVVAFFPCDPRCVDVTHTGSLHSIFSMPGTIGLPAAAMMSAVVFRSDGRLGSVWQIASFSLGLVTLMSGPLVASEVIAGANGLLQRAGMWPALGWMMAVSVRLSSLDPTPI